MPREALPVMSPFDGRHEAEAAPAQFLDQYARELIVRACHPKVLADFGQRFGSPQLRQLGLCDGRSEIIDLHCGQRHGRMRIVAGLLRPWRERRIVRFPDHPLQCGRARWPDNAEA